MIAPRVRSEETLPAEVCAPLRRRQNSPFAASMSALTVRCRRSRNSKNCIGTQHLWLPLTSSLGAHTRFPTSKRNNLCETAVSTIDITILHIIAVIVNPREAHTTLGTSVVFRRLKYDRDFGFTTHSRIRRDVNVACALRKLYAHKH